MRFLFIRHGEPDYVNDCITPRGQLQAAAAARRLACENICEIYASPLGRAQDWREHPYFKNNIVMPHYEKVVAGIDEFLESQGYCHEGRRFFCSQENTKTIALFSHGGSGGAALSHILSLPFPYTLCVFPYTFTSVIVVNFPSVPGQYVHPRVELFNDAAHIKGFGDHLKLQKESDPV